MSQEAHESESICLIGADGGTLRAEAVPHSVPELIGPIIRRLIETKRRTAIDSSSLPPPESPSEVIRYVPMTNSSPPTPLPTAPAPASVIDKGSKGPQATPGGRRKVQGKKRRLKFELP